MNANEAKKLITGIAIGEIAENENFSKDDATTAVCDRFERYHEEGKFGIRDAAEALGGLGQVLGIVTDICEEWLD